MYNLEETYTNSFFRQRHRLNWRVPIICNAIITTIHPQSVVDFGCACGEYVKGFLDRGIEAIGVEGSSLCKSWLIAPEDKIIIHDLRNSLQLEKKFDLVLCLEVAEHIEEIHSDSLINNFVNTSNQILLSAAIPGQGGIKHVNCKPKQYWVDKMTAAGYAYDEEMTERIKLKLARWIHRKEILVYYNNLMFFIKDGK